MSKILRFIVFILFLPLFSCGDNKKEVIVINEVSYNYHEDNLQSKKWIEIYNAGDKSVNLEDFYLSNNPDDLKKWNFDSYVLKPDSFKLIALDGKEREHSNCNFKIKKGSSIFLNKENKVVDKIENLFLQKGESFGRFKDGGERFYVFKLPSPGQTNQNSFQEFVKSNIPPGVYSPKQVLTLETKNNENSIYYTINGEIPDTSSTKYKSSKALYEFISDNLLATKVKQVGDVSSWSLNYTPNSVSIKAAVFDQDGNCLSDYFVFDYSIYNHKSSLGIFHLNTEPLSLLDKDTGLFVPGENFDPLDSNWTGNYYKTGKGWERKAHISYFHPEENKTFRQWMGMRAHGGNSRRFDQKGLRFYARKKYETKRIKHNLFSHSFQTKRFVLKPFKSSWSSFGFENYLGAKIASMVNVDFLEVKPVILYLNGVYWGIYFLEERMDSYLFSQRSGELKKNFDFTEGGKVRDFISSKEAALDYKYFLDSTESINDESYKALTKLIDIDNFIDYQILEQYIANFDWPSNNNRRWRGDKMKWRWIFFDGDASFGDPSFNSLFHAIGEYNEKFYSADHNSTKLFRMLTGYKPFLSIYLERLDFLLENVLNEEQIMPLLDEINELKSEVELQVYRFGYPYSIKKWEKELEKRKRFISKRGEKMRKFYREYFDLEEF